ncbi:MAG: dual specificity protein phosphatase family protein [bacterium]|nr:dual specificity protein phosphatase family protein [bacterium]
MDAIRSWLCVGKYRETLDEENLMALKIGAVLQLAEAIAYTRINALYLPVDDGIAIPEQYIRSGVAFVLEAKRSGQQILIACGAGISRSAAFAVAILKEAEDISLVTALRAVQSAHHESLPHPAVWESLCTYYQEDVPFDEVLRGRHSKA